MTRSIRRCKQKLGHDILRYVSKIRRSERDNYFFIGKKPSRKPFEKNNILLESHRDHGNLAMFLLISEVNIAHVIIYV